MEQVGGNYGAELRSLVDRIEQLSEEKDFIAGDI
ncbi:MAG: GapR family DNA-binding domain-containing protein, partial [Terriglobia bacterium]